MVAAPVCLFCSCCLAAVLCCSSPYSSSFLAAAAALPYTMSEDIEDLLDQLKKLASTVPHPPAAGEDLCLPEAILPTVCPRETTCTASRLLGVCESSPSLTSQRESCLLCLSPGQARGADCLAALLGVHRLLRPREMLTGTTPAGAEAGGRDKSRTVKRLPDEFVPLLTELAPLIERAREQQGERSTRQPGCTQPGPWSCPRLQAGCLSAPGKAHQRSAGPLTHQCSRSTTCVLLMLCSAQRRKGAPLCSARHRKAVQARACPVAALCHS